MGKEKDLETAINDWLSGILHGGKLLILLVLLTSVSCMADKEYTNIWDVYHYQNKVIDNPAILVDDLAPIKIVGDKPIEFHSEMPEEIGKDWNTFTTQFDTLYNIGKRAVKEPLKTGDYILNELVANTITYAPLMTVRVPKTSKVKGLTLAGKGFKISDFKPYKVHIVSKSHGIDYTIVVKKGTVKSNMTHAIYKHTPDSYFKRGKVLIPSETTSLFMSSSIKDITKIIKSCNNGNIYNVTQGRKLSNIAVDFRATNSLGFKRSYRLVFNTNTLEMVSVFPIDGVPWHVIAKTPGNYQLLVNKRKEYYNKIRAEIERKEALKIKNKLNQIN